MAFPNISLTKTSYLNFTMDSGKRDPSRHNSSWSLMNLPRICNLENKQTLSSLISVKPSTKSLMKKMLQKLHFYGIWGNTLNWIKDFLDNRTQSVLLNGSNSDSIPVSSGVPQGSVLGPMLFLVYINDLPDQVRSRVKLFTDDTAMYLAEQTRKFRDPTKRH